MFDDFQALTVTDRGDRLVVELTRPEVRNAIDDAMVSELHAVCDHLEREPKILIITGCEHKGRGIFASGADIGQLKERRREDALRGINNTIFHRIAQLPMPVIAAVDGYALGGGLELALAADFRIATEGAKFGQPEANLGIIAAAGGLWRIKALVGEAIAKEILLAGRILSGAEAFEAHLVTELAAPEALLDAAEAYADRIARRTSCRRLSVELAIWHSPPLIANSLTCQRSSATRMSVMMPSASRRPASVRAIRSPTCCSNPPSTCLSTTACPPSPIQAKGMPSRRRRPSMICSVWRSAGVRISSPAMGSCPSASIRA